MSIGTIYLIHFDRPLGHAKHYCGWTSLSLHQRLKRHKSNHGAALLRAVQKAGIGYHVVRIWKGSRDDERRIKNRGGLARVCPTCKQINLKNTTATTTSLSPMSTAPAPV